MNNKHLYILSSVLVVFGLTLFLYKAFVIGFPLTSDATTPMWNFEVELSFKGESKPTKAYLKIPSGSQSSPIMDENFVSSGYGLSTSSDQLNREAIWSIKKAAGEQKLFYRASVHFKDSSTLPVAASKRPQVVFPEFEGADLVSANYILNEVREKSAEIEDIVAGILRKVNQGFEEPNVKVLLGRDDSALAKATLAVNLLAMEGLAARVVSGLKLVDTATNAPIIRWIEYYDSQEKKWVPYSIGGVKNLPLEYFPWWRGVESIARLKNKQNISAKITINKTQESAVQFALSDGKKSEPVLLQFSMFSLPIANQIVFKILFMVPIGALIMVILRNVIGIKTFGTFMPVLIALAFRESELGWAVFFFVTIVSFGLLIRFYLDHLKLLLVPRLASVLTIVVLAMAGLSIIFHELGIQQGLSIALFPMVIMAMTIERLCLVWDELGPKEAISQGMGSLAAAIVCSLIMHIDGLQYLFFVFPELLLLVLAILLLMGRYTGYRLTELKRFKVFNRPI
jgi:7 transmembrane helices usually fused to an inactive transglutaminase/Inactive transglutaminase fused to 7 transmembrane helices